MSEHQQQQPVGGPAQRVGYLHVCERCFALVFGESAGFLQNLYDVLHRGRGSGDEKPPSPGF